MAPQLTKPDAYRQSLIAAWNTCSLRALFSLQDERRTPGHLAARGSLLHRAFHRAVRTMWAHGETMMSVEQGMELLTEVLCQRDVPSEEFIPLPMQDMKWCRVGMTLWCENTVLDARKVIATEERLSADLKLPSGEVRKITGQMDLIVADPPDGIIIIDYKTGFAKPKKPRPSTDPEKVLREGLGLTELGWVQNLVYCFLIFANFPSVERVTFREVHVMWMRRERFEWEQLAKSGRIDAERREDVLGAQVLLLDRAIEEGPASQMWTPSGGTHCSMCPRPWSCPILDDEQLNLHTEEGRMRVAQEWIVAGAVRDRRREILEGLVDRYGPIEVPHALGRRAVGYAEPVEGTVINAKGKTRVPKQFGIFEPNDLSDPYDEMLVEATREAGVLKE